MSAPKTTRKPISPARSAAVPRVVTITIPLYNNGNVHDSNCNNDKDTCSTRYAKASFCSIVEQRDRTKGKLQVPKLQENCAAGLYRYVSLTLSLSLSLSLRGRYVTSVLVSHHEVVLHIPGQEGGPGQHRRLEIVGGSNSVSLAHASLAADDVQLLKEMLAISKINFLVGWPTELSSDL